MKAFLGFLFSTTLITLLIYSLMTGNDGLASMVVGVYWIISILGLIVAVIGLFISSGIDDLPDSPSREKGLNLLKQLGKKNWVISRIWGWLSLAVITLALAYSGWVFTAVVYAIVCLLCRLCVSVVRDKLKALNVEA